jgi:hypothetical protein
MAYDFQLVYSSFWLPRLAVLHEWFGVAFLQSPLAGVLNLELSLFELSVLCLTEQ